MYRFSPIWQPVSEVQTFGKYGDSLYIAEEGEGLHAILTFREETSRILRDYFNTPNKDDDEAHKRAIIEAAAKFIKHDIKCITTSKNEYPNVSELNLVLVLDFISPSLRFMLENILPGKETNRKVASIGQTIVQAVRLRNSYSTITNWTCYSNAPSFPIKVSDRYSLLKRDIAPHIRRFKDSRKMLLPQLLLF